MSSVTSFVSRNVLVSMAIAYLAVISSCQVDTTAPQLEGVWTNETYYVVFRDDGSFSTATAASDLESAPLNWGMYLIDFEDETITFIGHENGVCEGRTGTYWSIPIEEEERFFRNIEDPCSSRLGIPPGAGITFSRYSQ